MPVPYDINTNKTYVGSEIAKSAMLSVARGQSDMVLVCSDGGFRKTYEAKRILRVNKVPFIEEAPQTDAVLVRYLYGIESGLRTFKGIKPQVLVADDADAGLTRPSMLNIYKSAWGSDRRMVYFKSTEIEKNEGYKNADTEAKRKRYDPSIPPSSFPVTVRLIQLSNDNYTDPAIIDKMGVHFRALVTKGLDPIWIPNDAEHDGRDVFIWTCWLATEGNSLRSEGFSLAVSRLALDFYSTHPHRLIDLSPRRLTLIARAYRDNPPGYPRDRALARMLGEDQRPKLKLPETWVPVLLWPQQPPRRNPDPTPDPPQPDPDPPKPPAPRPDAALVSLAEFRLQSEPTPPMADPPPPVSPSEPATGRTKPDRADAAPKPPSEPPPPPEPRAEELIQEPPRTENEALQSEPDCTDDTTDQSHAAVETAAPDTDVSRTDDLILDHALPTADRKQAFFGAVNCCRHLTENDQAIVKWIGWLIINDAELTERMIIACDTPRQILAAAAPLREQRPMLRDVPLDAFKPEHDPLDLPLPPIGERLAALGDNQFEQLTFGGGKASRDEHDLRELKSYAVALLQYHNMEVRVLLHRKREFWRPFMNDTTLRRLYETVFPPKPEGGYT